ncbi:MAG: tRNA 2-thiouridine(34) synthase MnmA [Coriobacteriales bacterium]|nr:tRNA 2-thiouridine(34) synthase MnmA [Coriobacteriales bacterium]
MTKGSVLIGMSGGVDSSVAAVLLKEQGYNCIGATMLLHGGPGSLEAQNNTCCSLDDVEDARSVARTLGIPHYAFDFSYEFERDVVSDFAQSYESGLTPNPCVRCNRCLKFGYLLQRARELGCDYIATGHYARVIHPGTADDDPLVEQMPEPERGSSRHLLAKAADVTKDQSYFLCLLTQKQLARVLLPLGELTKQHVRDIAQEYGLVTARKRESEDICFVPDGDYLGFLERRRGEAYPEGSIITCDGRVVGSHRGIAGYTIGQRKGLGVALGEPAYVCAKDVAANTVTLGPLESIMSQTCFVKDWNWIIEPPAGPLHLKVRTHYRHTEQPAMVYPLENNQVRVDFDEPQRAITPGQYAVAYEDGILAGGGMII